MIYAVDQVNSDPNVLPNVHLGGLGIDDCSSPILGQAFLAQDKLKSKLFHHEFIEYLDKSSIKNL
ncbi:metabotropic glutamate receptor 7 [Elysia marginata]|uniref:Metabotropic glutamate receptor 7 n=1 Tax=Elysia marginata TaxID=1093978 RepID=A0AAV4GYE3_9GAST|nr:metabotropic glutamate receptor 7 [Elysia marginata]